MGGITVTKIDMDRLRELLQQQPDATTVELHAQLNVDCTVSAVDMALRRLGWSYKKRRFMPPSRTGRMSRNSASSGKTTSLGVPAGG